MLNHMITAVNAVLPSFLIIALGLYIRSRGKLDDKSLGKFNSLAFRVFLPFQIFKNIYDSPMGEAFDLKLLIFGAVCLRGGRLTAIVQIALALILAAAVAAAFLLC